MRTLKEWKDLQGLLNMSEQPDLEFKKTINPRDPLEAIETAKDVAALANTQGGHLVIGAEDNGVRLLSFPGISPADARAIRDHIEKAPVGRCLPTPFITVQPPIDVSGQPAQVLVVRVEMAPIAPIGVNLCQEKGGKLVVHGWCFPYRVGSQTNFLTPDQFGAYESMSARRAAALLAPITKGTLVVVRWVEVRERPSPQSREAIYEGLDLARNVARFRIKGTTSAEPTIWVPLDDVTTVWRGKTTRQRLRSAAHFGSPKWRSTAQRAETKDSVSSGR